MKKLVLLVTLSLALSGFAVAQSCGTCPETGAKATAAKAKQECSSSCQEETTSARLAKLEAAAAKGCPTSKAHLAAMKKACGTECSKELATKLATLEKNAAHGCDKSKEKLHTLTAMMSDKPGEHAGGHEHASGHEHAHAKKEECCGSCGGEAKGHKVVKASSMSERVNTLAASAKKGCKTSQAQLAALKKACGTECCKKLTTQLVTLEKNAAHGCDKSKEKLASLTTIMSEKPGKLTEVKKGDCGSGCGDAKTTEVKKGDCGSSCGDAKKTTEVKKSDCGSSCGDAKKTTEVKKSDCGSSCGGTKKTTEVKKKEKACCGCGNG